MQETSLVDQLYPDIRGILSSHGIRLEIPPKAGVDDNTHPGAEKTFDASAKGGCFSPAVSFRLHIGSRCPYPEPSVLRGTVHLEG
jgi:hypothetical protein